MLRESLHVRVERIVLDSLDRIAESVRADRSGVIRVILADGLATLARGGSIRAGLDRVVRVEDLRLQEYLRSALAMLADPMRDGEEDAR